jgi:hypothetical protein
MYSVCKMHGLLVDCRFLYFVGIITSLIFMILVHVWQLVGHFTFVDFCSRSCNKILQEMLLKVGNGEDDGGVNAGD